MAASPEVVAQTAAIISEHLEEDVVIDCLQEIVDEVDGGSSFNETVKALLKRLKE